MVLGQLLKPIHFGIFFFQIGAVSSLAERFTSDFFGELFRVVPTAPLMDVGFEPLANKGEFAISDPPVPVGMLFCKRRKEMGRKEVAQSISWKIAKIAERPMDVLKTSLRVILRLDAEIFFHLGIPSIGKIGDIECSADQSLFDFKTENDMQAVGDFVRFYADEGRGDLVDSAVESIKRNSL